ncbi:L,D-transpeptidase family protein [Neorhizobium alkalisoli]|nr:L,D-transpeptidase [Neorhizobium alkalisoli]
MKTLITLAALATATLLSAPSLAAAIDAEAVNAAQIQSVPLEKPQQKPPEPDAAIVKLQVLLDRGGASPGVIDGFFCDNLIKAIAGFEAQQKLPVDGKLDPDVLARLTDAVPAVQAYAITADDGQDLVASIPEDYAKQAEMPQLGYTSIAEKLAERFHMDVNLLKSLNPTAVFVPGETIAVTISGTPKAGVVKRIDVNRKTGQVFALADDGALLSIYPATIGSEDTPSPTGLHKVKGVSRMPVYTYNPKINFQQGNNRAKLELPGGPNGPVGSVWIDLTEPTYGIHGTPEPELIGKAGSHGCVRLTNWDAEELAGMVKPGVTVEFVD